jgi:hypothetical protein
MNNIQFMIADDLNLMTEAIVDRHGFWRTLSALLAAALRRHANLRLIFTDDSTAHLTNRMRRDIGLSEIRDEPRMFKVNMWDIRL